MAIKMGNLSNFIKQTREEKGLSQEEVAKRAGLARSYVSRLEDGDYKAPSVMTLIRLAKGLGVSRERIFAEAGVSVRENNDLPAIDVYLRTKFKEQLSDEDINQIQAHLEALIKAKYANNHSQQSPVNSG